MSLTLNQLHTQNVNLLNQRLSNELTRNEVLEFCKRAKIEVCCEIVDDEVKETFHRYYGILLLYNINAGTFEALKLN